MKLVFTPKFNNVKILSAREEVILPALLTVEGVANAVLYQNSRLFMHLWGAGNSKPLCVRDFRAKSYSFMPSFLFSFGSEAKEKRNDAKKKGKHRIVYGVLTNASTNFKELFRCYAPQDDIRCGYLQGSDFIYPQDDIRCDYPHVSNPISPQDDVFGFIYLGGVVW